MFVTFVCRKMKRSGFTLIELLVTMSILGILTTLVAINIYGNLAKARDARRKSDLGQIKTALSLFYNNFGYYPSDANGQISGCDGGACNWGSVWNNSGTNYMKILPADPVNNTTYKYNYQRIDINSFRLWARLEVTSDPDMAKSQTRCNYSGQYLYVVCED